MASNLRVLAVIPARSGSKGLKDKNILPFNGKPLLAWSIEAAKQSKYVLDVVVSTDSQKYAEVAKQWGADVPFIRPNTLSDDGAGMMPVLQHAVDEMAKADLFYDVVVCLQPTSPLRTYAHINAALEYFESIPDKVKSLASVYQVENKYRWLLQDNSEGQLRFLDDSLNQGGLFNRQNNGNVYMPNGAIFIYQVDSLFAQYQSTTYSFVMDEVDSIDIDTLGEFETGEERYYSKSGK
jgi:CMP-N,N'-diacetyllegionaminic acid synthase